LEDLDDEREGRQRERSRGKDVPVHTVIANIWRIQRAPLTCNFSTR